jgi:hypothetical protein
MTDLHYLYHSLVADPTSTVTAIYSTQSHNASGGKKRPCRRAFYSAFETPGWQNNSKSDSRFSIRTVRWLGGLEQTHPQRAAYVHCIQWTHRELSLSYHSRSLIREIISFRVLLTVFRVWLQSSKILR